MNHIGIESTITIGGKNYKLSRFTRENWRAFLKFCRQVLPDPIEIASRNIDRLPTELANRLLDKAYEDSKVFLSIGSPGVLDVMNSLEGLAYLFWLLLREFQPDMTEEQAADLCFAYVQEHGQEALDSRIAEASGIMPDTDEPGQKKTNQ